MAARPRKSKNRWLEPNLYQNGDRFVYRNPVTGSRHGMGTDKAKAQAAARVLNARLMKGPDLVARVMGEEGITLKFAADAWLKERVEPHPKHSASTKNNKRYRAGRIVKDRGDTRLDQINTRWCAEYLDENFRGDPYVQYRAVLSQIFDFAITKGWKEINPITPTRKKDEGYTKQRRRLTVDQYRAIYAMAEPWFQIAMELGLICMFGRAEAAAARYDDIYDGAMHYIRQKTRHRSKTAYVAIRTSPAMDDLVRRSRLLPPVSPFIVHRMPQRIRPEARQRDHWSSVAPDMISRTFYALRDRVPSIAALPDKGKPTFHEIRSLGSWLMEQRGTDESDIQLLMGHADKEMTQHYIEGHGIRWQRADAEIVTMETLLSTGKTGS